MIGIQLNLAIQTSSDSLLQWCQLLLQLHSTPHSGAVHVQMQSTQTCIDLYVLNAPKPTTPHQNIIWQFHNMGRNWKLGSTSHGHWPRKWHRPADLGSSQHPDTRSLLVKRDMEQHPKQQSAEKISSLLGIHLNPWSKQALPSTQPQWKHYCSCKQPSIYGIMA